MTIDKPFFRLWRPVKGYEPLDFIFKEAEQAIPTLGYLDDDRFACQAEMQSLVTSAHLIVRDLYELFDYVEPHNDNQSVYSHRIYELFLRTATEFESNCKGILLSNGYAKAEKDMKATDYFKIAKAARLWEYSVVFYRWLPEREFKPFEKWNRDEYESLPWYKSYNDVKHNRYSNFCKANLGNLMDAVSGLLCILHAQIGENMVEASLEGVYSSQSEQDKVHSSIFLIKAPKFLEEEQYGFVWDEIKGMDEPVRKYEF